MWERGGNVGKRRECGKEEGMWEIGGNVGNRRECGK